MQKISQKKTSSSEYLIV